MMRSEKGGTSGRRDRRTLGVLGALLAATALGACEEVAAPSSEGGSGLVKDVPDYMTLIWQVPDAAVLLGKNERVVNLVLPGLYYDIYRDRQWDRDASRDMVDRLYARFDDVFDYVVITWDDRSPQTQPPFGLYVSVRRDTKGFGFPIVNDIFFGTQYLSGVVMLQKTASLRGGPSLHEFLHRWGQTLLPTVDHLHWGLSGVGGQLGGWVSGTLTLGEDGVYEGLGPTGEPFGLVANHGNRIPYAPVELYMLGLLPADSVGTAEIAVDGEVVDAALGRFRAREIETVAFDTIFPRFGPRNPGYPDAPTELRAMYVVLSPDTPMPEDAWRAASEAVRQFSLVGPDDSEELLNFWEATGGRGRIVMDALSSALR